MSRFGLVLCRRILSDQDGIRPRTASSRSDANCKTDKTPKPERNNSGNSIQLSAESQHRPKIQPARFSDGK